jgi:hypothetical protein
MGIIAVMWTLPLSKTNIKPKLRRVRIEALLFAVGEPASVSCVYARIGAVPDQFALGFVF